MKGIEGSRDQFLTRLTERLDDLDARVAKWERSAKAARSECVAEYHSRRDAARYNVALLETATGETWADIAARADDAWQRVETAYEQARAHFERRVAQ